MTLLYWVIPCLLIWLFIYSIPGIFQMDSDVNEGSVLGGYLTRLFLLKICPWALVKPETREPFLDSLLPPDPT